MQRIHEVSTEGKLVGSMHDADVIVELVGVGFVSVVVDRAAVSESESTGYREHTGSCLRIGTVNLDSHVAIREELRTDAMGDGSVVSESERLDDIRLDQQGIADRQ